ncbi:MAG: translation initiation factor IF-2 N-terminal domain-containing protein, partial [Bacillota bacterium]
MNKIRVYELAKELNQESKMVLETLLAMGVKAQNHMSVIEAADAAKVRGAFKAGGNKPSAPKVRTIAPAQAATRPGIRPAAPAPSAGGTILGRGIGRPLPKSESFQPPKTPPPEAQPEAEKTVKTEEIAAPAKPPAAANAAPAAPAAAPTT